MCDTTGSVLRDWSLSDGDWYVGQLGDPEIQRFTTDSPDTTSSDFRAALTEYRGRPDWAGFAIVDPGTGELAGNIAASRDDDGTAEISYWLAASARGRGFATRALVEMCAWLEEHWPECSLALWTHADNVASQRVAERAGFRHQPDRDEERTVGGRVWPTRWYARGSA
jgi:ribosomal-protein-alanine N-acetyltransferase